jgi:hypothetical protein
MAIKILIPGILAVENPEAIGLRRIQIIEKTDRIIMLDFEFSMKRMSISKESILDDDTDDWAITVHPNHESYDSRYPDGIPNNLVTRLRFSPPWGYYYVDTGKCSVYAIVRNDEMETVYGNIELN